MARQPNYDFDRRERERLKAEKALIKAEERAKLAADSAKNLGFLVLSFIASPTKGKTWHANTTM